MNRASLASLASVAAFVLASSPLAAHAQEIAAEPQPLPAPAETLPPPDAAPAPRAPVVAPAHAPPSAAVSRTAAGDAPRAPEEFDKPAGPPRHDYVRVSLGLRIGYVTDGAYDTFASNDVLPQFSVDASYAFYARGKLSVAAGVGWDAGSRSSGARGLETRLAVNRLTVPLEGRYHVAPWLYAFGKVAPGAAAFAVEVKESSSPNALTHAPWVFAADASVGASVLLGPHKDLDKRDVHFWITPELGYAFTTAAKLRPNPGRDDNDVLGTDERVNLGSLSTSGFFWRANVAMTF